VLGAIRKVREGPANVSENLLLVIFDENFDQRRDGSSDFVVGWLGSAPAHVGKGPGDVSEEGGSGLSVVKDCCDCLNAASFDHAVSEVGAVSSDVSDSPDYLLDNLDVWRAQEDLEILEDSLLNEIAYVGAVARRDIGQAPGSLELIFRHIVMQEGNEYRNEVGINHLLDGWNILD